MMNSCGTQHLLASYQIAADCRQAVVLYILLFSISLSCPYKVKPCQKYRVLFLKLYFLITSQFGINQNIPCIFFYLHFCDLLDGISMCWLFLSFSLIIWQPERARMRYKCKYILLETILKHNILKCFIMNPCLPEKYSTMPENYLWGIILAPSFLPLFPICVAWKRRRKMAQMHAVLHKE